MLTIGENQQENRPWEAKFVRSMMSASSPPQENAMTLLTKGQCKKAIASAFAPSGGGEAARLMTLPVEKVTTPTGIDVTTMECKGGQAIPFQRR